MIKTLPEKFREIKDKNPYWSSYVQFVVAVGKKRYFKTNIIKWFNKFVDNDDYDKNDKERLLNQILIGAKKKVKSGSVKKA